MSDFKIDYNSLAQRLMGAITEGYSIAAKELSERNGEMIDHGIGVTPHQTYEIKRLDSDYFGDG